MAVDPLPTWLAALVAAGYPRPEPEVRFHLKRRWKFDWLFREARVAVEEEGITPAGGRHQRFTGYENDCEKYAEALCMGYRVLRVTPRQIRDGRAMRWLEQLLKETT